MDLNKLASYSSSSEKILDMTILVIDDEPGFVDIFETLLSIYGYKNIITTCDSEEAIRILKSDQRIDLVLTDVNMPKMGGFEILEFIKGVEFLRSILAVEGEGPGVDSNDVRPKAKKSGIGDKALRDECKALGVVKRQQADRSSRWWLPGKAKVEEDGGE